MKKVILFIFITLFLNSCRHVERVWKIENKGNKKFYCITTVFNKSTGVYTSILDTIIPNEIFYTSIYPNVIKDFDECGRVIMFKEFKHVGDFYIHK